MSDDVRPIPPAPVVPPVANATMDGRPFYSSGVAAEHAARDARLAYVFQGQWPEGYHAADHLHPFDCTPADLDQED